MAKPITPNKARRLAILERALNNVCALNVKWCFALSTEPNMKYLLKKKYVILKRHASSQRLGGKGVTKAEITKAGREYLEKNRG
jgi:hypothetical protein